MVKNPTDYRVAVEKLFAWARKSPDQPALYSKSQGTWGEWKAISWNTYLESVRAVGKGLIALGFQPGDCAAIISRNRPEWVYAQHGIQCAGGYSSSIYVTNPSDQVAYIAHHSRARFIFAEDEIQYRKLKAIRPQLPRVEKIILMDAVPDRDPEWTIVFSDLLAMGSQTPETEIDRRVSSIRTDDTAMLIYTSGTTGRPKGVVITHENLHAAGVAITNHYEIDRVRVISYLPLCHIAEQIMSNTYQLFKMAEVYFCPDIQDLYKTIREVRPTFIMGVPRIWEKLQSAIESQIEKSAPWDRLLIQKAKNFELECFKNEIKTQTPVIKPLRFVARQYIQRRVRATFGLEDARYALTGAAPVRGSTLEFFASIGLPLVDGFGMSETTGPALVNHSRYPNPGSIGKPLPGMEAKLAEDGELLFRGPNVTPGYFDDPEATSQLIQNGWLHTGDIAIQLSDGSYRVTDRKKDILITAGGKNVAPLPIETQLKSIPGIQHAVVLGDRMPYLVALLTLDPTSAPEVARGLGIERVDISALVGNSLFHAKIQSLIESEINSKLARFESIKKFKILPGDFSVAGGELTPTLKIRRKNVMEKYVQIIRELYSEVGLEATDKSWSGFSNRETAPLA